MKVTTVCVNEPYASRHGLTTAMQYLCDSKLTPNQWSILEAFLRDR